MVHVHVWGPTMTFTRARECVIRFYFHCEWRALTLFTIISLYYYDYTASRMYKWVYVGVSLAIMCSAKFMSGSWLISWWC